MTKRSGGHSMRVKKRKEEKEIVMEIVIKILIIDNDSPLIYFIRVLSTAL